MMICEQCKQELTGSSVRCQHCGYNAALQRLDAWRERRQQKISSLSAPSGSSTEEPTSSSIRTTRSSAKEATLIRFPQKTVPPKPVQITSSPTTPVPPSPDEAPAWKEKLDRRLQEIREQRALEVEPPAVPKRAMVTAESDENPIVAKALNRINRVSYLQPVTPPPRTRLAVAVAQSHVAETQVLEIPGVNATPTATPFLEAKAAAPAQSRLATAPQFLADPMSEFASPALTDEEDLLPEIVVEPISPSAHAEALSEDLDALTNSTLEAASLAKRAAAAVIDAEIIASSLLPLFGAYFFLSGWVERLTFVVPLVVSLVLVLAYFFVTYALAGRTMGMAWCNLHLASLSPNDESLTSNTPSTVTFTIKQAVLRSIGSTLTLLLFPLNVLCIARSDDRLSISDYLSSTQVVRIKK